MKFSLNLPEHSLQNVLSAILCVLIGIGFLFSFIGFEILSVIVGAAVLAYAVCRIALIVKYRSDAVFPAVIVGGFCYAVLLAAAGLLMIFKAQGTVRLFALIIGLYLLVKSTVALVSLAFSSAGAARDKTFWIALVFSAVTFAVGLFLAITPDGALRAASIPVGILMIVQGVKDLYFEIRRVRAEKKDGKERYIEADFEDKTDKN